MSNPASQSYLIAIFRRTAAPIALSMVAGCASTVHKFDPDYCMEWTESEAKLLVTTINSRSESVYQNACVQGRAGAQVTLIGNNGKQLHPVSASIGKEFLKTITQKAADERRKRDENSAETLPMGDGSATPQKREDGPTFYEKVKDYFNFFLAKAGFSESEIGRDAKLPEATAKPQKPLPNGCTKTQKGFDCN